MYKRVTFVILGVLLIGAVLIFVAKWFDTPGTIVDAPLVKQFEETSTHQFSLPVEAQYRVGVECSRKLSDEKLRTLLQRGNLIQVALRRGAAPVNLNYLPEPATSPGPDSSAQFGNLNFGANTVGQDIAYFKGIPGETYEVSYTLIRPLDELSGTNPTFVVYFNPAEGIGRGFVSLALLVTGYTLLALGAALCIYHFFRSRT